MRGLLLLEDGVALPVALAVLALVSMLSGAVLAEAVSSSYSSTEDRDSKRAFSAAEAGLQAASYRLSTLTPDESQCFTNTATARVANECPAYLQELGNGARYRYHVTPALASGEACAGTRLSSTGSQRLVQRCVTAEGEVNGVQRRVQARVAALRDAGLFPLAGIIGKEEVLVENSGSLDGPVSVGSNGRITLGNSSEITGTIQIPISAPQPIVGNSSRVSGGVIRRPDPWVLPRAEFGNTATQNDNQRIVNGRLNPRAQPYDPSRDVTYNATTRELRLGNNGWVELGGGTYNFCSLTLENSNEFRVAAGARARIFIDSPQRPGSGCRPKTAHPVAGSVTVNNSARIFPVSGVPIDLQLYVYGSDDTNNLVDFKNSIDVVGTIHAPYSTVDFKNSANIRGAVAANRVWIKNSINFTSDAGATGLGGDVVARHMQTAWRECTAKRTVSADPESGC